MKKIAIICLACIMVVSLVGPLGAAEITFHGDMNHRFQYANQAAFLTGNQEGEIRDGDVNEWFGELKYRFWVEAELEDNDIIGVLGTEIGGLRFGEDNKAQFSGDQVQFEVRWAYIDFQLPQVENIARFKIGLQPFSVNNYLWQETAAGVAFESAPADTMTYSLAWMRGAEYNKTIAGSDSEDDRSDLDSFLARLNIQPSDELKGGIFLLYQGYDSDGNPAELFSTEYEVKRFVSDNDPQVDFTLWSLGVDGALTLGNLFLNWDAIYQIGEFEDLTFSDFFSGASRTGEFDLSAYFVHLDAGFDMDPLQLIYTFWYASGDDDATDSDFNGFLATDVDITDSIVLMEGNYADDDYFMETPYLADKGFIMNRLGVNFKATEKTTMGAALLYMLVAEDIEYTAAATGTSESNNELGWEIDAFVKHLLYEKVEVAFGAGYLFAGDALDAYEEGAIQDGSADEDIFILSARVRYIF